jgi:hypothetical protein
MFDVSCAMYHKQIVIQYNDEQFKAVPILVTAAPSALPQICK